ncbi:hypothetical protein Vi05172_g10849 [Venturia inaequalis]|nr:hypothetical protein Vi05172_g10849 [Venturia inaequalis]
MDGRFKDIEARQDVLIGAITKLEECGIKHGDSAPPRIVVVGDQSTGKSSLIEAIAAVPVPRGVGTCTKVPSMITMIRVTDEDEPDWKATVKLMINYSVDKESDKDNNPLWPWVEMPNVKAATFDNTEKPEALGIILQRGQKAALNPHLPSDRFTNMKADKLKLTEKDEAKFSPNCVHVEIRSRSCPSIVLFDLPGIISHAQDGDANATVNFVQALARMYAQEESSIVLNTMSMSVDINNNRSASIIEDCGARDRSFGVLTKPDLLGQGYAEQWTAIIRGEDFVKGFGYYVVRLPGYDETSKTSKPNNTEALEEEARFFKDAAWASKFPGIEGKLGVENLRSALIKALCERVDEKLPALLDAVCLQIESVEIELRNLPPSPAVPAMELFNIANNFYVSIRSHVDQPSSPTMVSWRKIQDDFCNSILIEQYPTLLITSASESSAAEAPETKRKLDAKPRTAKLFKLCEIRAQLDMHVDIGNPSGTNPHAMDSLVKESQKNWESPINGLFRALKQEVATLVQKALNEAVGCWEGSRAHKILMESVARSSDALCDKLRVEYALQYLKDEQEQRLTISKERFRNIRTTALENLQVKRSEIYTSSTSGLGIEESQADPFFHELGVFADVRAYYTISSERLTGSVCHSIQAELFACIGNVMRGHIQNEFKIGQPESIEKAAALFKESPEMAKGRARLIADLQRLKDVGVYIETVVCN